MSVVPKGFSGYPVCCLFSFFLEINSSILCFLFGGKFQHFMFSFWREIPALYVFFLREIPAFYVFFLEGNSSILCFLFGWKFQHFMFFFEGNSSILCFLFGGKFQHFMFFFFLREIPAFFF